MFIVLCLYCVILQDMYYDCTCYFSFSEKFEIVKN